VLLTQGLKLPFSLFRLIFLAVLVRLASFFLLMADPDEWSYIISASELLNGEILYFEVIDIKPPGIFLLFMALIKAFGMNMFIFRIFGAVLLGTAAWSAGRVARVIWKNDGVQWPASMLFLSAFIYPMGNALNTEVFYVSFAIISLQLLSGSRFILAGAFMAMAFVIKYTLPSEFLLFAMILLLPLVDKEGRLKLDRSLFKAIFKCATGFLVVLLLIVFWMQRTHSLHPFMEMMTSLPGSYAGSGTHKARLDLFALYHFRFVWLAIPAYWGLKKLHHFSSFKSGAFAVALVMVWLSVVISGKLHDHYWLQLAPLYSILGAGVLSRFSPWAVIPILLLSSNIISLKMIPDNTHIKVEAAKIKENLQPKAEIWVAGLPSVYYHLLQSDCPTPYIHGSLLSSEKHLKGFQIDRHQEWLNAIHNSDALLLRNDPNTPTEEIFELGKKHYEHRIRINEQTTLFLKR
jgi:hypothetical protein